MSRKNRFDKASPAMQLLKPLGLIIVFAGAGILFWYNFEYSLDKVLGKKDLQIKVAGKPLSKSEREIIQDFSKALKKDFGLDFKLLIRKEEIVPPEDLDSKTFFFGICPHKNQVLIKFPVLLEHSLPSDFQNYLQSTHFDSYWQNEQWPKGLLQALSLIWNELNQLKKEKKNAEKGQ